MAWPSDDAHWKALADGERIETPQGPYLLHVVDCGELVMPTGRLVACDPFTSLGDAAPFLQLPPGKYSVKVTLADVSGKGDGSHIREAYATLLLSDAPEVERRMAAPLGMAEAAADLDPEEFFGFGVDSGTACFVDGGALASGMPDATAVNWYEEIFDSGTPDAWFTRMDDPAHIRAGLANVPLPLATDGANIVIIHSGWGDGFYPVVGGYDAGGKLVRAHIDFFVVSGPDEEDEEAGEM